MALGASAACGPLIERAPFAGPPRFDPSGRSAGSVRRHRARRRSGSPDRRRHRRGVLGVRERHRLSRAGRLARGGGRRPAPTAATRSRGSTICRRGLSARIRRFTLVVYHRGHVGWRSDSRVPRPGRAARLQPARQPRAARALAAGLPPRQAPGVPGRRRQACAWRRPGSCRRRRWSWRASTCRCRRAAKAETGGAGWAADAARHLEAAHRRRDPRRHRLRRQVRGRQADRPADDRVLRQPPLQGARQARELRRRPAGLAPRAGRRGGPVQQAADRRCRARKAADEIGDALVPRAVGRDQRARLPGARARRRSCR